MAKIMVNSTIPDFTFQTPYESLRSFHQAIKGDKSVLLFLRYIGCTLCQYQMHLIKVHYDEITKHGGRIFIVLQTDPDKALRELNGEQLPFTLICDPNELLYQQFEIHAAASKEELIGSCTPQFLAEARKLYSHGDYEGNELQLPATFIIDSTMNVTYARYGTSATDIPTPEELTNLLGSQ